MPLSVDLWPEDVAEINPSEEVGLIELNDHVGSFSVNLYLHDNPRQQPVNQAFLTELRDACDRMLEWSKEREG